MPPALAEPASWVIASLALYLGWAVLDRSLGVPIRERMPRPLSGPALALAGLAAAFAFYVGLPYLALVSGALDLRTLGLAGGDPLAALPVAALIALVTWALLATSLRRASADGSAPPLHTGPDGSLGDDPAGAFAVAVAQQCHVALYRGAIALVAGTYAGVFAGLALVALERMAGAAIRRRWPGHGTAEGEIVLLATLAATSLAFLATGSLLACILAHFGIEIGVRWSARRRPH